MYTILYFTVYNIIKKLVSCLKDKLRSRLTVDAFHEISFLLKVVRMIGSIAAFIELSSNCSICLSVYNYEKDSLSSN